MILCIETSGEVCSIAIKMNSNIISSQLDDPNSHSKNLIPMIKELFAKHRIYPQDLKAVALSAGPGSYTGLRIGSAVAKSICMANKIPLISIDTLWILAYQMKKEKPEVDYYIPMLDARRMEVYMAVFDNQLNRVSKDTPLVLTNTSHEMWDSSSAALAGSGAQKAFELLKENYSYGILIHNLYPLAMHMVTEAEIKFYSNDFVDIHNFEPLYLKPFYTTAKIS